MNKKKTDKLSENKQKHPHKNDMDLLDPHGFWGNFKEFDNDNKIQKQEDKE
ncbi:MAG: hypothetical protein PVJ67_05165 [Candidatus Pacearchaeota archaeon]|jgi:hypothetical protein